MAVATIQEFVVALENKPGALAELAGALGRANVNLTGFAAQAQGDFGVLRFTTPDPARAEAWLKASRHPWHARGAVLATSVDRPGELGRLAQVLAAAGVNIEAAYHVFVEGDARILFSVTDASAAAKALG